MRVIRKYRNRRLYDTYTSRTITQFDLARLVESGVEVQVLDSDTGEDITAYTLGRVLLTESSHWADVKERVDTFRELIAAGGDKSMSILKNTVLASIGMLHVTKKKAEEIIDELIKRGELDKSDRKKAVMELVEKAEKSTSKFREKLASEAEKAGKDISKFAKDLNWARANDLKKLETKVNKLAKSIKQIEERLAAR